MLGTSCSPDPYSRTGVGRLHLPEAQRHPRASEISSSHLLESMNLGGISPQSHSSLLPEVPQEGSPAPTPASPPLGGSRPWAATTWPVRVRKETRSLNTAAGGFWAFHGVEYHLFHSEKSTPVLCRNAKRLSAESTPWLSGDLSPPAGGLEVGSSKKGTLEGLHQVAPGPLRDSSVQRGRGLLGHNWGQKGGFQCAVQQRRVYTVGILDAGPAPPSPLLWGWAQQSPLPTLKGMALLLGKRGKD